MTFHGKLNIISSEMVLAGFSINYSFNLLLNRYRFEFSNYSKSDLRSSTSRKIEFVYENDSKSDIKLNFKYLVK